MVMVKLHNSQPQKRTLKKWYS